MPNPNIDGNFIGGTFRWLIFFATAKYRFFPPGKAKLVEVGSFFCKEIRQFAENFLKPIFFFLPEFPAFIPRIFLKAGKITTEGKVYCRLKERSIGRLLSGKFAGLRPPLPGEPRNWQVNLEQFQMRPLPISLATLLLLVGLSQGKDPLTPSEDKADFSYQSKGTDAGLSGYFPAPTKETQSEAGFENGPGDNPPDDSFSTRFWVRGEYLFWWLKGASLPPLVTTSPTTTAQGQAGVIGADNTRIVFGNEAVNQDGRSGGKAAVGYWFDNQEIFGVDANFFVLQDQTTHFKAGSTGNPIFARPFINAQTGAADAELVSFPNLLSGTVAVTASSGDLLGGEINFRQSFLRSCDEKCGDNGYRLWALFGYRFLQLDETLAINEALTATGANNPFAVAQGTTIGVSDRFRTNNEFHGGNFGLVGEWHRQRISVEWLTKLAVGFNHEIVDINGSTQTTTPGQATVTSPGGLLALPTNLGHFSREQVAVVPEFHATLGFQVTSSLRLYGGYTLLYWSQMVRPGNQIDPNVDPSQLPPSTNTSATHPAFVFHNSDLWVQGLDVGLQWRY